MQMGAVVEPACSKVGSQIGHQVGQLRGVDVVQAKLLKAGGVDQGGSMIVVYPVPGCTGRGVFA